VNRI